MRTEVTSCPDATREELIERILRTMRTGPRRPDEDDLKRGAGPALVPPGTCRLCGRVLPWAYVVYDGRADPKPTPKYLSADDPAIAEWQKLLEDPANIGLVLMWPMRTCEAAMDEELYDLAAKRKEIEDARKFGWDVPGEKKKKKKRGTPDEDEPTPGGPREKRDAARNPYGGVND